jgi:hypothetical protein
VTTRQADPETVLRLACERVLLGTSGPRREAMPDESISELAAALVVLADLDRDTAEGVVDDYAVAIALRGQGNMPHRDEHRRSETSGPLTPPAVAHVNRTVEVQGDEVHVLTVVFRRDRTEVHIRYDARPSAFPSRGRRPMGLHLTGGPPSLSLSDDAGTASTAHFSGGGGDAGWEGRWTTEQPLSSSTRWLALDGTRVDLDTTVAPCTTRTEERTDGSLAQRYLWQRLVANDRVVRGNEHLLDALVEVGALTEDDLDMLAAYDAVLEAMPQWGRPFRSPDKGIPPALASYLQHRGTTSRREVALPLTALLEVGSFQVLVYDLRTTEEGFCVRVVVHGPGGGAPHYWGFDGELRTENLAWWAEDDRGNSYLGQWGESSSSFDEAEGSVHFTPGLDRKATVLRVLPTTLSHRGVLEVALP